MKRMIMTVLVIFRDELIRVLPKEMHPYDPIVTLFKLIIGLSPFVFSVLKALKLLCQEA